MAAKRKPDIARPVSSKHPDAGGLAKFVEVLQGINTASPKATLNTTSIADNNGGRILL
ncbi:MAG: hypothetical protein WDN27_00630 [Candidatus Saccharibacteria bacterium]